MRTSIWLTAHRRKVRVCDMGNEHLRNTINMIARETPTYMRSHERNLIPIYHEMVAELRERETKQREVTLMQLTESQAWQMIGEAFEAKAAHPDLKVEPYADLAGHGLCFATGALRRGEWVGNRASITGLLEREMDRKTNLEVKAQGLQGYLSPGIHEENGAIERAMLAYLFAAEAAA